VNALRILLTNLKLDSRTGTETFLRDLAPALLRRGHAPAVYSPRLGEIADELRWETIPVVDDLARLPFRPDVVHGQHHPETMAALLRHPGVPGLFVCHDASAWHDEPPRFPRIVRYVAVDEACRERLTRQSGIPPSRVDVVLNFVDLERFRPRPPLPDRPRRALAFSNHVGEDNALPAMREACRRHAIALDVIGSTMGTSVRDPERRLGDYDLVFAIGRSALEAIVVGAAVVLCGIRTSGEMVTSAALERLRRMNFGRRTLVTPTSADTLSAEIERYDAGDAAAVSQRLRANAGLDAAADRWIEIYRAVIAEAPSAPAAGAELEAAADYVTHWRSRWVDIEREQAERDAAQRWLDGRLAERGRREADHEALARAHASLEVEAAWLRAELERERRSVAVRLGRRLAGVPVVGRFARALARLAVEH
jgi:Glycosyltransferase Family 4